MIVATLRNLAREGEDQQTHRAGGRPPLVGRDRERARLGSAWQAAGADRTFDLPGALTVTGGITLLVVALVQGPDVGWVSPWILAAAVVFFGVSGAMAVAQSGSFNIGFVTMPLVFQQMPFGHALGAMWFGLLFFAGITSSVAMATPIVAFFREEFGFRRETVSWIVGGVALCFGLLTIAWFRHGFLWEWDFWAGTFGLAMLAMIEVVLFMWVFGPERAWRSLHQGADIRIPRLFKFVMTYVTPVYLGAVLQATDGDWGGARPIRRRIEDHPEEPSLARVERNRAGGGVRRARPRDHVRARSRRGGSGPHAPRRLSARAGRSRLAQRCR